MRQPATPRTHHEPLKRFNSRSGAIGALAIGALAVGAFAIGALAVGRLAIGRARIGSLTIDELTVKRVNFSPDEPKKAKKPNDA